MCEAFVGAGTFNWRTLAKQTTADSVTGLGEAPYFPTLRAPRKKTFSTSDNSGFADINFELAVSNAATGPPIGKAA